MFRRAQIVMGRRPSPRMGLRGASVVLLVDPRVPRSDVVDPLVSLTWQKKRRRWST